MKIRILNNSLRIRVSQTEMKDLSQGNAVSSFTSFPNAQLNVSVIPIESDLIKVDFRNHSIIVDIPLKDLKQLNDSSEVSLNSTISTPSGDLSFLFEKDFKCLTDRKEDESDLFKNPLKSH